MLPIRSEITQTALSTLEVSSQLTFSLLSFQHGETALHNAVMFGNLMMVLLLLERNADMNICSG